MGQGIQNSPTWPTGIATRILEFNFGKSILDNSKWDKIIIVGIGVPTPRLKNTTPSFFPSPPLKPTNCPSAPPPFQAISLYILVFQDPSQKSDLSVNAKNIRSFSSFIPSYLLKVTKFLGKISQFEFLVMTEKNIFAYKLFLSLNISDFNLFLYEN